MKVLGRGWQYTTYDLGNGRVLKKYNSLIVAYWVIFFDYLEYLGFSIWKIPAYHRWCKGVARDSMQKISNNTLEPWMMGNPKVLNGLDYEQDKLKPLHDELKNVGTEAGMRLVDDFIVFNKILVERSLIDKNFNIGKNFGLDMEERIVLMDLGELYSDRAAIEGQQRDRPWRNMYVADTVPDEKVRQYYLDQMDKAFGL